MNRLTFAIFLALALAPSASAAPLNELPFQALPERGPAACLRGTGVAGGLALFGPPGSADLWQASGSATARGERARLGLHPQCAAVAESGGAAVAAALVSEDDRNEVRAALRDPGGAFGLPMRLSTGPYPHDVSAAVARDGSAVVAWTERRGELVATRQRLRVVVARRLPGGGFGAPEPLTGWWTVYGLGVPNPQVGVDSSGTVSVAWSQATGRRSLLERVHVAVAAPGAPFTRRRLGAGSYFSADANLAVAPDGWSLVVHGSDESGLAVFERGPGAERFTRVLIPQASDAYDGAGDPAAAIGAGGGAVVAWRLGPAGVGGGVAAMTRAPGGAFGAPEIVDRARRQGSGESFAVVLAGGGSPPVDNDADRLGVALGSDGRALIAWLATRRGMPTTRARAAVGVLGGAFEPAQDISRSLRDAEAVAPLFLPEGRAGVAWIDNAGLSFSPTFNQRGEYDGRLHLAVEGAPAPVSATPRLRLRAARVQRLFASEPVRVTARCDRPCDVLGAVRGSGEVSVTLPTGSGTELELPRGGIFEPRDARHGRLIVEVRAAEPGGRAAARRTVRVRVVRRPPLPLRRPLDVRARRRGDAIVVRWRTAAPARRMYFSLLGHRQREPRDLTSLATAFVPARGRTRFTARLLPERPARIRWVSIYAVSVDRARPRSTVVRVR
jgi:hypothetical protein